MADSGHLPQAAAGIGRQGFLQGGHHGEEPGGAAGAQALAAGPGQQVLQQAEKLTLWRTGPARERWQSGPDGGE